MAGRFGSERADVGVLFLCSVHVRRFSLADECQDLMACQVILFW